MFTKLKPARTQAESPTPTTIVCDFDSLMSESVGFKFQNKTYVVAALDLENYMQVTLAYKRLMEMISQRSEGESLDMETVYGKYYDLVHPLAPTFAYEDLKKLPFPLLNHLMNLILRQIAGDPTLFDGSSSPEKKNSLNPLRAS